MSFKEKYLKKYKPDIKWDLASWSFESAFENYTGIKDNKIPKKIHQIWVGSKPVPKLILQFAEKFKELNPDWEYKLWRDKDIDNFKLKNKQAYDKASNCGSKSDIARYNILYKEGGIYFDTDFLPLKALDDLIYLEFFTGTGWLDEPLVFNGIFGCIPRHPLLLTLINNIKITDNPNINQIMQFYGPGYFSKYFFEYLFNKPDLTVVFPTIYFYPFAAIYRNKIRNWNNRSQKFVNSYIKPESYACHLWHTSWQS